MGKRCKFNFSSAFAKTCRPFAIVKHYKPLKLPYLSIEQAKRLSELSQIKAIEGHPNTYRLRVGNYRLGFRLENNTIIFVRVLHRREIYRYFP